MEVSSISYEKTLGDNASAFTDRCCHSTDNSSGST